ncbi:type II secretion system protein [Amycolatopsis sp. FU40]|uniref:type II secretion system F family protein n=1 Tax=Amycolatopsis sp. FU40 TaxID=2914159 RepID=UPI001F3BC8C1|nr:type II secretion system F family protein [Amycolatopsis sp. FU40]UKD58545.1 type II secretion system protein [Amycolatopsis sp. FU40]
MTSLSLLILLSIGFAAGVTMVAAAFVRTRPRLADIVDDAGPKDVPARFAFLSVPLADLELVGQAPETFLLHRIVFAAIGALWVPLLSVVLAFGGVAPPVVLTGVLSLATAVVGWTLPAASLKSKVTRARAELRGALACYCRLVALGRIGDRGPVEALRYPASLGEGWTFRRIRDAMDEAALLGDMPWDGLQRLGTATGVRELSDLTHVVASAGHDGASIVTSLRVKADSIEQQLSAERKTGAAVRSDRMDLPLALLGLAFVVFLAFPGVATMLTT